MRGPQLDLPVVAFGALASAALSVGVATALFYVSRAQTGANVGPTAAALHNAFDAVFGAALGLLAGSGLTACFARRGSRVGAGMLAGFLAYLLVLLPVVVVTGPSDVSPGESLSFGLLIGIPLGLAAIIGSPIGAGIGARRAEAM